MPQDLIIEMKNIVKKFPGVKALDNVDLDVRKGEIHVLLGENGAGKSTLMKILTGAYTKTSGKIFLEGKEIELENPQYAMDLGISMIYQEFNLAPQLSIKDNLFLGREKSKGFLMNDKKMYEECKKSLEKLNLDISPETKIKDLGVAKQQMVEIAKAISVDAKIIIMDEPTAALTNEEKEILFGVIHQLKNEGRAIIYISHLMEEINSVGDRVTILRDGLKMDTVPATTSSEKLIELMVGRKINDLYPERNAIIGDTVLEVSGLERKGILEDINFDLREGEILGVAGLVGSGRTELVRAIFGADPIESGTIKINNKEYKIDSPKDAIDLGLALVPESRKEHGLALDLSVAENITLSTLDSFVKKGFVQKDKETEVSEKYKNDLRIKTPSLKQKVMFLSGGNQQKVVISKWLCSNSKILFFDEPTRGIDVGTKQEIYKIMNSLAENGNSIIMISSYLPEVLAISDRILVMSNGKMTGILDATNTSQEEIMKYATMNMN